MPGPTRSTPAKKKTPRKPRPAAPKVKFVQDPRVELTGTGCHGQKTTVIFRKEGTKIVCAEKKDVGRYDDDPFEFKTTLADLKQMVELLEAN